MNSFKRILVVGAFLLSIAAMFWAFQRLLRHGETETSDLLKNESSGENETASPVDYYLLFIDTAGNTAAVEPQTLIVEGLRKLAGAVGHLNLGTLDVQVSLRVSAEHVLLNPDAPSTTEAVRNALVSAAEAIEAGGTSDGDLRQLAVSLRSDRRLTEQHETILEFFRTSGDAMKRAAPTR